MVVNITLCQRDRLKPPESLMNAAWNPPTCVPAPRLPPAQCGCDENESTCNLTPSPPVLGPVISAPSYITGRTYHCVTSSRCLITCWQTYQHNSHVVTTGLWQVLSWLDIMECAFTQLWTFRIGRVYFRQGLLQGFVGRARLTKISRQTPEYDKSSSLWKHVVVQPSVNKEVNVLWLLRAGIC